MRTLTRFAVVSLLLTGIGACRSPEDTGTVQVDGDGDGYGAAVDCDDTITAVHPGADEVCDGLDDDCDGVVDEDPVDGDTFHADADGDGYGDPAVSTSLCAAESGWVGDDTDCDDGDATVYPGADEVCGDGVVNDCDGTEAEATAACLSLVTSLADAGAVLVGENAEDEASSWLDGAGDVNGDGYADLLVAAEGNDAGGTDAGAAYVVLGPVSGTLDLASADAKLVGRAAGDGMSGVAGAGDTNGDGLDDVLVTAPGHDAGGSGAGAVYLVQGPITGTLSLSGADATLVGENAGDALNWVDGGDMNGDGLSDLLMGARWHGSARGAAWIVYSPVSGTEDLSEADVKITGMDSGEAAGLPVCAADVDADGVLDLLMGADFGNTSGYHAGAAYVVLGPIDHDMDLSSADAKLLGEATEDRTGNIRSAGDVDGDGREDILVGSAFNDGGAYDAGAAYLFLDLPGGTVSVATADMIMLGEGAGDSAGNAVSGAGDIDGDGFAEFVVSALWHDEPASDAGAAYIWLEARRGTVSEADADFKVTGAEAGDWGGYPPAAAGDVDGDGLDDLLLGASQADDGGTDAGAAYVLFPESGF